ncbi:DUF4906 domain-containing protein [Parabacteroides segnis]|uniref:DUF4906 domain-containing protein n=1 Tax=Parabacteroides segnis TaxID=2763058 RepID=UPI003512AE2B
MASIGQKLETKGVIMTLLSLVLISTGCEEQIDSPAVNPSEGKTVEVTLDLGFADEADGYTLSAPSTTKSNAAAFNYALQPRVSTKGVSSLKPDKLYNLEIQQYDRSGKRIGGMTNAIAVQEIGSALNLTLAVDPDCQLVIVAWGSENTATRLGTTDNLATVQSKKSIDASTISSLQPGIQADMNKMPYVLHLEHVCVESNTIKSIDGEDKDVRLLLRRLATRLTLDWTYSYTDYALKQILLQSIPTNYKVVAAPDKDDNTYPSLLDQFTTIQLTPTEIGVGKYSCWIPANVRGTNPAATSQTYRIKSNAPTGSSYVDFIAFNTKEAKKKLSYRVYLGGSGFSDFNLYSNTDYDYTVTIKHAGLPVNDRRVTIIDPIPASENNNNLVPTANCFMVAPGGAFCFNPYIYYVNGASTPNSLLQDWCATTKIQSVRVLWQTKENGDIGDPVLGVANSSTDHENIVDLTDGDIFEKARIYCRVAPNTTGGSGIIAAYDDANGEGNILWSWHIWVTDYSPDARGNEDTQLPENKRKLKFSRNDLPEQLPMMDRNLGAMTGYTTVPPNQLEISKTNGYHYQWGRKDPFRSSYTAEKNVSNITIPVPNTAPVKNLLSLYQPDGISYYPVKVNTEKVNYRTAYANPVFFIRKTGRKHNGIRERQIMLLLGVLVIVKAYTIRVRLVGVFAALRIISLFLQMQIIIP